MSLLLLFNPHGPPLPVLLDATADYIEGESTQPVVFVSAYFYNPDTDVYSCDLIDTGTATLVYNGGADIQTVSFDRRFATLDGPIYIQFSHPPARKNLSVRIEADLRSQLPNRGIQTVHLQRVIPVTLVNEDPIPLAAVTDNGDDANGELRGLKRIEELI